MPSEGHQRLYSILSDITEEEMNSDEESDMAGDPRRTVPLTPNEFQGEDDDSFICIEIRRSFSSTVEEEEFSPAPNIQRSVSSSEIEEERDSSQSTTPGYGTQPSTSGGSEAEDSSFTCQSYNTACYEIEEDDDFFSVNNSEYHSNVFSLSVRSESEEAVYVAVGKSESSMDALSWALTHYINPSTNIYLIHVFPEIRSIPSPLGMLPRRNVSPVIVHEYLAQVREKRKALLQKFLDTCSDFKIQNKVDAVLVESEDVAKTILNLIPFLNIKKLVLGTTKSRKSKFRKNGIAHQIYSNAPELCEARLICRGKVVMNPIFETPSPSQRSQRSMSRSLSWSSQIFTPEHSPRQEKVFDQRQASMQCLPMFIGRE